MWKLVRAMRRVRVGAVGTGGIFQNAHLPAYPDIWEAQLVALCDVSEEALRRAGREMGAIYNERIRRAEEEGDVESTERLRDDLKGVGTYTGVTEMLSKEEIDLLDICTPTKFHDAVAIGALNAGVHVMVEKPMARTYLECLDVVEAVEDSGKLYQHNENYLYLSTWYNARKFIESGVIGEVQFMFLAAAHGGMESAAWFWDPAISGGGSLLDMGVHPITTSWFLSGFERRPTLVKAAEPHGICTRMRTRILKGRFQGVVVEDDAHILVRYEDAETGAWSTAHIEGSWSHRDSPATVIIGTDGRMEPVVEEGRDFLKITGPDGGTRRIPLDTAHFASSFKASFPREIRNMCNCVVEKVKPISNEKIGAETTAIVGAAYLSQKMGKKAVSLDEFKEYALKIREREGKRAPDILLKELLKGIQR